MSLLRRWHAEGADEREQDVAEGPFRLQAPEFMGKDRWRTGNIQPNCLTACSTAGPAFLRSPGTIAGVTSMLALRARNQGSAMAGSAPQKFLLSQMLWRSLPSRPKLPPPPSFRSNRLPNRPLTQPPRYFNRPSGPIMQFSHRHRKASSHSLFLFLIPIPLFLLDLRAGGENSSAVILAGGLMKSPSECDDIARSVAPTGGCMRKLTNHARHSLGLLASILVMSSGAAGDASWREINTGLPSAVVGVRAITIDPVTPSTIYVCSYSWPSGGSIFKSTDGGGSWKAISSVVGARSVVIDPKNSSTIFAGTVHGIVKSTNGGESWSGANTGLTDSTIYTLAIDPITPSTLYAVTFRGIFKSTNGGETWNAINTGFPSDIWFDSLVIDPMAPSTLYAVTFRGIFKSTDGGGSWKAIGGLRPLVIDPTNSSTIYAVTLSGWERARLVKSTDGGETWNAIETGPNTFILSLAIDPITPSTVYAAGGGIFKSTDGGETWNAIEAGLPSSNGQRFFQSLALDPTAPSTIYAGYFDSSGYKGAVYKSTNGGASWDAADAGLTSIDVRVLAIDPANTATVYTAAGNAAFKSVDSGASWTKLFTFQIANATFPSLGFGADDAIVRSLLIDLIDPNVLYVETARTDGCASGDKLVFKSTDGGASWSPDTSPDLGCGSGDIELDPALAGYRLSMVLDPTDRNTLYVGGHENPRILKSHDGGANWSSVWGRTNGGLESSVFALVIDPTKPTTLYAGTVTPICSRYLGPVVCSRARMAAQAGTALAFETPPSLCLRLIRPTQAPSMRERKAPIPLKVFEECSRAPIVGQAGSRLIMVWPACSTPAPASLPS
jgi:photosystem II stability/assembly factor-like uncharacterized protein